MTTMKGFAKASLNWERIAAWSHDVVQGDFQRIADTYSELGAMPPRIHLSVEGRNLPGVLEFLFRHWRDLSESDGHARMSQVDPFSLRPALGFVNLMDVIDGGRDFRYRLFGSTVASRSEFDLTGKLLSEFPARPHVPEFMIAVDRAVCHTGQPIYSIRMPYGAEQVLEWHRLTLPLYDESDQVARLMVGVVPRTKDESRRAH